IHRLITMLEDFVGNAQFANFLGDHLPGMGAENKVHFMRRGIDLRKEPLEIDSPAGPGAGDDEPHRYCAVSAFSAACFFRYCFTDASHFPQSWPLSASRKI